MDNEQKTPIKEENLEQASKAASGQEFREIDELIPQSPHGDDNAPEPPANWSPDYPQQQKTTSIREAYEQSNVEAMAAIGKTKFKLKGGDIPEFRSARNLYLAAVIIPVVSIFFGGIILSALGVMCAFVANGKFRRLASSLSDNPEAQKALTRSGVIAIVVAIGIFVLNIIALALLYPMVADTMQNGGPNWLGGSSATTGSDSTNVTWG